MYFSMLYEEEKVFLLRNRWPLLLLLLNFTSGTYAHNDKGPENT